MHLLNTAVTSRSVRADPTPLRSTRFPSLGPHVTVTMTVTVTVTVDYPGAGFLFSDGERESTIIQHTRRGPPVTRAFRRHKAHAHGGDDTLPGVRIERLATCDGEGYANGVKAAFRGPAEVFSFITESLLVFQCRRVDACVLASYSIASVTRQLTCRWYGESHGSMARGPWLSGGGECGCGVGSWD